MNAASLGGLNATNFWQVGGNTVSVGQFFGSVNNQPVELWVNASRGLRLEPSPLGSGAPNVIGGSQLNSVSAGVMGATISGGGATNYFASPFSNSVTGNFGTVGGGGHNVSSISATVGGGIQNTSSGIQSTVGGGELNTAGGQSSTVAGGAGNNAGGTRSAIGGGDSNTIQPAADHATIGGGTANQIFGYQSTIGGGYFNAIYGQDDVVAGEI